MSNTFAPMLVPAANMSIRYAEAMLKDVPAREACRLAAPSGHVLKANHPAWVIGHLALYSSRVMELLKQPAGPTAPPAGWADLFKNGTPCLDDPDGKIYPPISALAEHFLGGYRHAIDALAGVPEANWTAANPVEGRMRELFPLVGGAVTFLLTGHPMSHLGQISTWRRAIGLGSAMG